MDDVDLDRSPMVANMLLLFGRVTNPTIIASFMIAVVVIGSSLSLFVGGCTSDDVTLALWRIGASITTLSSLLSSTMIALRFGSLGFGSFGFFEVS
jgi:hypothetical protein